MYIKIIRYKLSDKYQSIQSILITEKAMFSNYFMHYSTKHHKYYTSVLCLIKNNFYIKYK